MKERRAHQHVDMVEKLHAQCSQLQHQLGIVSVGRPVLPRPIMMHVPQMNHITAEKIFYLTLSHCVSLNLPYDGVHSSCKENENFRVEEGKMAKAVLPTYNSCHHEEPTAGQEHCHQQHQHLGMGVGHSVGREGQL